ncbi:hypothetical protein GOODEAATRI_007646, partial [Goodea atripinnis]
LRLRAMQSLFGGGELGLLGGGGSDAGGLKEDGCGSIAWRTSPLPGDDVYSASHFTLISAYQEIKMRLASLERENTSIKRKLKIYEIKVKAFFQVQHLAAFKKLINRTVFIPAGVKQKDCWIVLLIY